MLWDLILDGALDGEVNMAIDAALLDEVEASSEPKTIVRFYRWARPTVSLGRNQKVEKAVDVGYCREAGIDIVNVPYKGGKESLSDLLGDRIEMSVQGVPAVLPQIRSGAVRAIFLTGPKRSATLPDLLTIGEAGLPKATANVWFGLLAPSGTPRAIIERLNADVLALMKSTDVIEGFVNGGSEVATGTPEEFARMIRDDVVTWAKVIKQRGIKVD